MFFNIIACLRIFGAKIRKNGLSEVLCGCFFKKNAKKYGKLGLFVGFSFGCFVSWVMFNDFVTKTMLVDMGVNLSRPDVFVP